MQTLPDPSFIVFSDDWGEHPSSCQHIFRHIAREHRVLWVNTIGMRNPRLNGRDLTKAGYKLRKMLFGDRMTSAGYGDGSQLHLRVYQPPMLPFAGSRLIERFNTRAVVGGVRRKARRFGMNKPILVATVPNAADYVGYCGERRTVYYCVDDFGQWPGLDHERVRKKEQILISKADRFIATSDRLFRKLSGKGKPVFLLAHGVDRELFGRPVKTEHILLRQIPRPRVGYFGLFDERSDQEILKQLALSMPHIAFVITGRVEADISRLRGIPNLHFTGPVPYDELPHMVHGWDACVLAYVRSPLTDSVLPLKLKEYLATGKPVISSPIPEARKMGSYLRLAESIEDWIGHLEAVTSGETIGAPHLKDLAKYLHAESWQRKAKDFYYLTTGG